MHKNNEIMKKVTIAKGDGIGPEIMEAVLKIIKKSNAPIDFEEIETHLVRKECIKQGIPKPKKQDLVNCAFQIANNKLNELMK